MAVQRFFEGHARVEREPALIYLTGIVAARFFLWLIVADVVAYQTEEVKG